MGINFTNGLLAGVTAAVIWTSICLMVGMEPKTTGMWALIFFVGGTVISTVIANVISRGRVGVERT